MSKINFNLTTLEKALIFQITGMDTRFRTDSLLKQKSFMTSQNLMIISDEKPGMKDGIIYVWGYHREQDLVPYVITFRNNRERDNYKVNMVAAISEWSNKWKGWKDGEESYIEITPLDPPKKLIYTY